MAVELVRAKPEDAEAFYNIEKQVESRLYVVAKDPAESAEEIKGSTAYFIVEDGKRIGLISYTRKSPTEARINQLVVSSEHRGHGAGTFAFEKVLEELSGTDYIDLVTHPENPARRLYERHGFTYEDTIENYFGSGEPRVHLSKKNGPPLN